MGQSYKRYRLVKKHDGFYLSVYLDEGILFPTSLEQLLSDLVERRIPYEPARVESCYEAANGNDVKIAPRVDNINTTPLLKLQFSSDKLKAYLKVIPFVQGQPMGLKDIQNLIKEKGIRLGVQEHILNSAIEQQEEYGEWLIAQGVAPVNGKDSELVFKFNPDGLDIKPLELADGSVDFYNLDLIQVVDSGTVLVEKIPPTPGTKGVNIYGEEMVPKAGQDIRLPLGQYTQAVDNNLKLIATRDGHVVYINNKVNVLPSYEVKGDVDFNTGNIRFPGNVKIFGNVKTNFEVEASGDIEIFGNVEGIVKSASNIQVKNGIVRGKVVAQGCVYTKYIENGTVESGLTIMVNEAVMHSNLKAGKKVIVGGKRGLLVGGSTIANDEIHAKNIGSNLGTGTALQVGISPDLKHEYMKVCQSLNKLQENYDKNQKVMKILQGLKEKGGTLPPDKNDAFVKISRLQYSYHKELGELEKLKQQMETRFEQMDKAKITVENKIFAGVSIQMNKAVFNVIEEMERVRFALDGLDIKPNPLRK